MKLIIREVIKSKGLTVTELADRMGINRVNLSSMINGNPTLKSLELIAETLEVDICDLFASGSMKKEKGKKLFALIKYEEEFYSAETLQELEQIVQKLKAK